MSSTRTQVTVTCYPAKPCPGPPVHDCTDQLHPLMVWVGEAGADAVMVDVPAETARVAVCVMNLHGDWLPFQRVGDPGAKYAMVYECACGCGDTWQPEQEF